jgi:hypothetical protein
LIHLQELRQFSDCGGEAQRRHRFGFRKPEASTLTEKLASSPARHDRDDLACPEVGNCR